ncbi:restriction endonuclease subunit S [Carnobacteriaceae bacterium zg-84]|nr:restriction endonuclease subunit S [Carnobacteriaceae bacterium zg-84]
MYIISQYIFFIDDWEQRKLEDFGKSTGGTSIESEFDELGKYKVISIGSYSETNQYTDQGIRANKTKKTENRILNKNNLTMILNDKTASGNIIGRVLLIDSDNSYIFNQRTERIEVYENEYLPEFLYQFLNADNIRGKIICASQGNTQIYVNWTSIRELTYEIPVLKDEQRKIADLFNQLDNLIAFHQRKLNKLKILKKTYLSEMFLDERKRIPKRHFSSFIYAWEQRKFINVFDYLQNNSLSRSELTNKGSVINVHYGDVLIKYGEVLNVNKDELTYILDDSLAKKYQVSYLKNGDVIIADAAEDNTVGKCSEITGLNEQIALSGLHTIPCRSKIEFAKGYLGYYMNSDSFHNQLLPLLQGTKVSSISKSSIKETEIIYPKNLKEQEVIGEYLSNLNHLIALHQRKLEKLKNLKKAYLNELFV